MPNRDGSGPAGDGKPGRGMGPCKDKECKDDKPRGRGQARRRRGRKFKTIEAMLRDK